MNFILIKRKLNVNGGAIALGHPIGASGARILVSLIHEMKKTDARHGLATLCIGGGQGVATIVENAESKIVNFHSDRGLKWVKIFAE